MEPCELNLGGRCAGIQLQRLIESRLRVVRLVLREKDSAACKLRRGRRGIRGHRLIDILQGLVEIVSLQEQLRLRQEDLNVPRLLFQDLVDRLLGRIAVTLTLIDAGLPQANGNPYRGVAREALQNWGGFGVAVRGEVVVRERQPILRRARRFGGGLQVRLGLGDPIRRLIEERHHAIGEGIFGRDRQRVLEGLLGLRGSSAQPIELCEGEPYHDGSRVASRGFPKSRFGRDEVAPGRLKRPEVRVCGASIRGEPQRLLDFLDRAVQILQTSQRVAEHDLRLHVLRIFLEHAFGARARVRKPAGKNEKPRGLELDFRPVGQEVGRADGFVKSVREIAGLRVGHGQLVAGLTEPRVLLQRVLVLDDGGAVIFLRHERLAAVEEFLLGDFRIPTARSERRKEEQADGSGRVIRDAAVLRRHGWVS